MYKERDKDENQLSQNQTIHLCLAHMSSSGEEINYINRAFDERWVASLGPNVGGFEEDLRRFVTDQDVKRIVDTVKANIIS